MVDVIHSIVHFLVTGPGTDVHAVTAIAPLILAALIGAGGGMLKSKEEQEEANRQRKFESERERWSPWTGVHGSYVKNPNEMGNIVQGAGAGASFGQGLDGFGQKAAAVQPTASSGMESNINYSGMKGIGPQANGQAYANSLKSSYGPYSNGSLYEAMIANQNKKPFGAY